MRGELRMQPELSNEEFNALIQSEVSDLLNVMSQKNQAAAIETKNEVDKAVNGFLAVMPSIAPNEDALTRILILNRAVSYLHMTVTNWYAEACCNHIILKKENMIALKNQNTELVIQNDGLKDAFTEAILMIKDQAITSLPPKDRAKPKKKVKKKTQKKV